jgi:hypothetical protein
MYSLPGNPNPDVVTQESLLLGAVERVGRIRQGRIAVHVHLSRLRPQNRQDGHVRIALRMLEPMVNAYRGQMFLLTNSDVVFMLKDANLADVENMIYKLRALFSKDPLTFADTGDGVDNFCTWYDLAGEDYDAFLEMAREVTEEARVRNRDKSLHAGTAVLDAKMLGDLLERLARTDIRRLIRRQSAIAVGDGNANAEVIFQEFFVSVTELQKELASEASLLSNRWLFQHLSLSLDQRVLGSLMNSRLAAWPVVYGLNLNLATVRTPAFQEFADHIKGNAGLSIEIQVLDVLADSRGYFEAHKRLHEQNHWIVLDGINALSLQFMDVAQFKADFYKLNWSPEMGDGDHGDQIAADLARLGMEKIVLGRCDSEAAIQWGLGKGIQRFQGRYVDTMLAAYTMAVCDKSAACTLGQCIARHGVLSGPPRPECGNQPMLDTPPVMRAIKAKVPQGAPK